MFPQLPSTTLFPYTTLFRSIDRVGTRRLDIRLAPEFERWLDTPYRAVDQRQRAVRIPGPHYEVHPRPDLQRVRSEEHTSELQSQFHLVCRLLLEKKKKKYYT